jgi:hypothetical protein
VKIHPVAELFPMLSDPELAELGEDIKKNGQINPIVVRGNEVLDGRNRLAACRAAGVDPIITEFHGDDPIAFIVSANLRRRHLTGSQRAMIAAELSNLKRGRPKKENVGIRTLSASAAADLLDVSRGTVQEARAIRKADPALADEVRRGETSVNAAKKKIELAQAPWNPPRAPRKARTTREIEKALEHAPQELRKIDGELAIRWALGFIDLPQLKVEW